VHFEIYESLDTDTATAAGAKLRTSQLAIPNAACDTDMVFSDGYSSQLAQWSGSPADRIQLKLNFGV
jgi:hypothetical protein